MKLYINIKLKDLTQITYVNLFNIHNVNVKARINFKKVGMG